MTLSSKQRQFLKRLAHTLSPVVRVGRGGISEGVIEEAKKALEAHELIKVRIELDEGNERRDAARRLAAGSDAVVVSEVGKTAVLYRTRAEKPTIKLPV